MDAPVFIALGLTCLGCLLQVALTALLNMLTTSRHPGRSIPQGDWVKQRNW